MVRFMRSAISSLLVPSFFIFVSAQSSDAEITSAPSTASAEGPPSSTRAPITSTVNVGDAGNHKYKPDIIEVLPGDTVRFEFGPTNHSVVRAEYGYPCIPYEMTGRGKVGFFSGFFAVDTFNDPPTWDLLINDTDPIFFYCSAPDSCLVWEMVGVINPNGSVSLDRQKQLAGEADYMLSPGEPFPAEASSTMASLTEDPTARPTGVSNGGSNDGGGNSGSHSLSGGAIAGIAIGGVAVLLLAAALFFFIGRSKGYKFAWKHSTGTVQRPAGPGGDYMAPGYPPDMYQVGTGMYTPNDPHRSMNAMSPPPPFYPKEPHQQVGEMESPPPQHRDTFQSSVFSEQMGAASDRYSVNSERPKTLSQTPAVHEMYVPPASPPLPLDRSENKPL